MVGSEMFRDFVEQAAQGLLLGIHRKSHLRDEKLYFFSHARDYGESMVLEIRVTRCWNTGGDLDSCYTVTRTIEKAWEEWNVSSEAGAREIYDALRSSLEKMLSGLSVETLTRHVNIVHSFYENLQAYRDELKK